MAPHVDTLGPFRVPWLPGERRVRVFVPRPLRAGARLPVLYMFDGQNLFDDGPSFSGGWHLHLYLAHDHQIAWTNISGYNLQRAWEDFDPEIRGVRRLDRLPRVREGKDELWANLNTSEVYHDSEALKALVVRKILDDPVRAAGHILDRLAT